MFRIRKVIELIRSLAQLADLSLDPEKIKAAILTALHALQATAAATPAIWDDLAVSAAIWAVENLWGMVWDAIRPAVTAAGSNTPVYSVAADTDLETALARQFPDLAAA